MELLISICGKSSEMKLDIELKLIQQRSLSVSIDNNRSGLFSLSVFN